MRRTPWVMYLWPGLPQLWLRGAWSGLGAAALLAAILNLLLLASLIWVELLSTGLLVLGWVSLGLLWCCSAVLSARFFKVLARENSTVSGEDLFCEALGEYLRGNWFAAEANLARLLQRNPRDVEAQLMLSTLLRHTRRYPEARQVLSNLERLEAAEGWKTEIVAERELLARLQGALLDPAAEKLLLALQSPDVAQAA